MPECFCNERFEDGAALRDHLQECHPRWPRTHEVRDG